MSTFHDPTSDSPKKHNVELTSGGKQVYSKDRMPHADTSQDDTPQADTPRADTPQDDNLQADTPRVDTS